MKNGQNIKLGDSHVTPINIEEVQASNLGDYQGIPFFMNKKYQVLFQYTIFLLLHMICVILGASVVFAFSFVLLCLLQFMVGSQYFQLERDTLRFHCLEHSSFHSYCSVSVHFLLVLRLALVFHSYFFRACWFASVIYDQLSSL